MIDNLKCPFCGFESDYCDFPDLFYTDENNSNWTKQYNLQKEIQQLGYNIVTCGDCGEVFIIKKEEHESNI